MTGLYRKAALEKISSPEQLDQALRITSPLSWLVLIGITMILAAAGIWSVRGTLHTTVSAAGIIASPSGTDTASSLPRIVICRIPQAQAEKLRNGMQARVYPDEGSPTDGYMAAAVIRIDTQAVSAEGEEFVTVVCELYHTESVNSYVWSDKKGGHIPVEEGMPVTVTVMIEENVPFFRLFSKSDGWGE